MFFKHLFPPRKWPEGCELEALARKLGISLSGTATTGGGRTGTDEYEVQRRISEAIRARRDAYLWLIALIAALASVASAMAAWVAVWKS